jgi:hypothetical protein
MKKTDFIFQAKSAIFGTMKGSPSMNRISVIFWRMLDKQDLKHNEIFQKVLSVCNSVLRK